MRVLQTLPLATWVRRQIPEYTERSREEGGIPRAPRWPSSVWGSFGDPSALSDGDGDITDLYSNDWFLGVVGHTGSSPSPIGAGGGYVDPDTGGINHGGGGEYEPWLGGGPSVAQMILPDNGNVNYGAPLPVTNSLISEYMHLVLDVVGIFDPTPFCDGINTFWYCAEGDYANAGISAIGIVPFVGDLAKVGRLAKLLDAPTNSPGIIVIGESMDRVRGVAHLLRADVYNPPFIADQEMQLLHNWYWIQQKLSEGYTIFDIGIDATRVERSVFYAMERDVVQSWTGANVEVVSAVFAERLRGLWH